VTVLAIDPGNAESAYCFVDSETLEPGFFGKVPNEQLLGYVIGFTYDKLVIERISSYGMAVGKDVFETCEWIGRFTQAALPRRADYLYRREEKLHICGDSRANDANIRRALIDRFAQHDLKTGKGTKKNPDWFYGFHADIWAAYAVGVTYVETSVSNNSPE
jgi:hypothetical protein